MEASMRISRDRSSTQTAICCSRRSRFRRTPPHVTITQYGVVDATLPGQPNPQQVGQIQLTTFPNPGGLEQHRQ